MVMKCMIFTHLKNLDNFSPMISKDCLTYSFPRKKTIPYNG